MKHAIKGLIAVLVLGGVLYFGWLKYKSFLTRGQRPPEGTLKLNAMEKNGVPDFTIKNLAGEEITLSKYKGKIVIVNFWASWCEPCVKEFPSLIRLLKQYPDELVLLAISADYTLEDLTGFAKAFKVSEVPNFIVMWDNEKKVADKFGTEVLPESYIIGKDGKLVRKVAGVEDWDSAMAIEFFKQLL